MQREHGRGVEKIKTRRHRRCVTQTQGATHARGRTRNGPSVWVCMRAVHGCLDALLPPLTGSWGRPAGPVAWAGRLVRACVSGGQVAQQTGRTAQEIEKTHESQRSTCAAPPPAQRRVTRPTLAEPHAGQDAEHGMEWHSVRTCCAVRHVLRAS